MKTLEQLGISPAPWKYIGYHYHRNGEYIHLGEVWVKGGKHKIVVDISQPDARLIAAAPELYDMLQSLVEYIDRECIPCGETACELMAAAHNVLAKAAGESEVEK